MSHAVPSQMTAIEIGQPGPPEVLRAVQRPVPELGAEQVLIRVAAAGVNRADVLQRKGAYPPPRDTTDIPGLEVAGEVVRIGTSVTSLAEGQLACALLAGGGYAQYVAVPAVQCLPVPAGLDLIEAAVVPEAVFTVYYNVFERAGLRAGETLLVHGGASGIGTAAIALAKARGARVLVTAGTAQKCAACKELGADEAINYSEEDFVAATLRLTEQRGADVILDMVGGDYIPRDIAALAVEGRIALIALQKGTKAEIDLRALMSRRLMIGGSTLRAQSVQAKGRLAAAVYREVWPLFATHGLKPVIHARFALAQASEAHALMESGAHIGKIVLIA